MQKRRVLFVNISYCYDGNVGGHFRYVKENNTAGELFNFEPIRVNEKNMCWGFFEPGFTKGGHDKGGKQRRVFIERIDKACDSSLYIDNVTVIWCAQIDTINHSSVIGWYNNARVYRDVITLPYEKFPSRSLPEFGSVHNVESLAESCVLLPVEEIMSCRWLSPRQKTDGYGFGQSNMWYAEEPDAKDFVDGVLRKIDAYTGKNRVVEK